MHSNSIHFPKNPNRPIGDQAYSVVPPELQLSMHIHGVDFNPSIACPRNFIIFDRNNNQNQIVYHPDMMIPNFPIPDPGFRIISQDKDANGGRKTASLLKEDSADIDALLSSEFEEEEEETVDPDDDVVSTARTGVTYECSSPDSCSNYEPMPKRKRLQMTESCSSEEKLQKRQKLRKMVKTLKGIVPGARQMSTAGVLDEAVRYLKALRVEVKKMEEENSKG